MKITIKVKDGQNICYNGKSEESVKELKARVQEKEGFLAQQHNIIFNGENLIDDCILSDYNIQDDSVLLLVNKEKSLLLKSSIIFDNSNLIDRIHQSIIDLKKSPHEDDVIDLLNEAISFLDEDLKPHTKIELFSLIISCSLQYPNQSLQLFNKRLQKGNISSNHIISFAKILSNISMNLPQISINDYDDFISNSFQQISLEIRKSSDNYLVILGNEIPPQFKNGFITDIILLLNPTEQIVKTFSSYIINPKSQFNIINFYIKKVNDSNLLNLIPESLLNKNIYDFLTIENRELIIKSSTKQTFRIFLHLIERDLKNDHLSSSYCSTILNKLIEFDISLVREFNDILFTKIDNIKLDYKMQKYLKSHNIKLPNKFLSEIGTLRISLDNIKLFYHPEKMLGGHFLDIIYNATELGIYEILLSSKICSFFIMSIDFWKHILTIISSTEDEITDNLIKRFSFYLTKNCSAINEEIFDGLIFDEHLPNEKQSNFLLRIFIELYGINYDRCLFIDKPERFEKLFSYNEIPCKSLCKLFLRPNRFLTKNPTSKELYFYVFSFNRYESAPKCNSEILGSSFFSIDKIKSIFNMNDSSNEPNELLLTQFIKNKNDFSLISKFDEKTFSLVVSSLAFANYSNSLTINQITKKNALPFYAMAFHANNYNYDILSHSTEKMLNALFTSIRNSGNYTSILLNESINSILSIGPDILIKYHQSNYILDILFDLLIHGKYQADKLLLFNFIFYASNITNPILTEFYLDKIIQYGIRLFNVIFQNRIDIINSQIKIQCLNLKVFDSHEIQSYIENVFHNFDSNNEIFQAIVFYTKFCINQPILNINSIAANKITQLYHEKVIDEKWDDFTQIFKFMSHNKMNINFDILKDKHIPINVFHSLMKYSSYFNDIENCLYQCLNNPDFENNDLIIIQLLLQNKTIVYKYIVASLEQIYPNICVYNCELSRIFEYKPHLYQYKDDLCFVLKHLYAFDKQQYTIIKKLNVKQPELPSIDYSFYKKIIQLKNYQSFNCLHHIALCFPFLFENDCMKIVDLVLPTLNSLSFTYDKRIKTNDLKTLVSALSFLDSCLQSTKFISSFITLLFENIESLTESQIVCMSIILISLFKTDRIDKIIYGYAIKYNLIDKLNSLLTKDVSNEIFKSYYISILYDLLNAFLVTKSKSLNCANDYLFINQISNGSISNPFDIMFNFYTVIPVNYAKLSFNFQIKNESTDLIDTFFNEINKNQYFCLLDESYASKNLKDLDFLMNEQDEQYSFIYENYPYIKQSSNKVRCYLISQPEWAFNIITKKRHFPILSEHYSFLAEIKKNAPFDEEDEKEDEYAESMIDDKIFANNDCYDKLIKTILKDYLYSEITYKESYSQLILLLDDIKYIDISIKLLIEILLEIETPPFFNLFYKNLFNLLHILIENEDSIVKKNFFEKVGTKLINYFLSPYLIDDILPISKFLISLNINLPIQITHIIEHLLNNDQSNFMLAYKLYSKLDKEKAINLIPSFTSIFLDEVKKPDIDYNIVGIFIKEFPFIAQKDATLYDNCLSKCIYMYLNSSNIIENQILCDFIIDLFNFLAPERYKYQGEYSSANDLIDFPQSDSDEKEIDFNSDDENDYFYNSNYICLHHVQNQFYYKDKSFWQNIYEKHRKFLSVFSVENEYNFEKLTFLHDYYELIPFEFRLSYYKKKISQYIHGNYNLININVSRSNILEDTLSQINCEYPKFLIGNIKVHFEGEYGIDEGGLTSEWFSFIIKELFDPRYGLFISNENNCYHPNQLSYFNANHIDYFKLAGKIIALSLLSNHNINAHFSMAFYRQILHQKITFKDLENFDHSLFNSLENILNADDIKDLDLVFSIDDDAFGKVTSIDLIENGKNIQVTNDNRMDYVSLYVNHKLRKSVIDQINAFCNAFDEIIPPTIIKMFSPSELDLLICGMPHIDLADMKAHTHYQMPYHETHPTIIMFFNVLEKFTQEDLAKFLVFLTGSSQVPIGGFENFEESGNPIKIIYNDSIDRLPVAHTCFRILDLPSYEDENELENKLLKAINECNDFGLR